jgi:carbon-monoxide dehydrogenase small subunit
MEISALNLLQDNPTPTDSDIRMAISGNLCRCTGYNKIVDAIAEAGRQMKTKPRR